MKNIRKHVVFDLDDTLALIEHRKHFIEKPSSRWPEFYRACVFDEPNEPVIAVFEALKVNPVYRLEIWTGRSDEVKSQTEEWLAKNGIEPELLIMRPAKDHRKDTLLKEKWLRESIEDNERGMPYMIFEDRDRVVQMWRRYGITCCQVAKGDY